MSKRTLESDRADIDENAKVLDTCVPGWYKYVNPLTLNMMEPDQCILGQIFGNYEKGCDLLGWDAAKTVPDVFANDERYNARWEKLWTIEILTRQVR